MILSSAMSNAEENFGISRDDLFVYRIFADDESTDGEDLVPVAGLKPLLRRSSHITVILRERVIDSLCSPNIIGRAH
jgi:large subunit ribosomal protein L22